MPWYEIPGCVYFDSPNFSSTFDPRAPKFAMFDIDNTLITPRNGRNPYSLHKDNDDKNYIYLSDENTMFQQFDDFKNKGYVIAFITNQARYHQGTKAYKKKFENIRLDFENRLGWSPYFFICISNEYLKPSPKAFVLLCNLLKNSPYKRIKIILNNLSKRTSILGKEYSNCFYCGDASGKTDPYAPYRYSAVDRNFAANVSKLFRDDFNIPNICKYIRPFYFFGKHTPMTNNFQELVINIGNPGSGKSTTSYRFRKWGYKVCVMELLKKESTIEDCVKNNLEKGNSVVLDGMNYSSERRQKFINIAKNMNIPVRFLWFIRDGRPFNELRGKVKETNTMYYHTKPVPEVAYNNYSKYFEKPTPREGFVEIVY
jgi:hypothetical protein